MLSREAFAVDRLNYSGGHGMLSVEQNKRKYCPQLWWLTSWPVLMGAQGWLGNLLVQQADKGNKDRVKRSRTRPS